MNKLTPLQKRAILTLITAAMILAPFLLIFTNAANVFSVEAIFLGVANLVKSISLRQAIGVVALKRDSGNSGTIFIHNPNEGRIMVRLGGISVYLFENPLFNSGWKSIDPDSMEEFQFDSSSELPIGVELQISLEIVEAAKRMKLKLNTDLL